jgi:DNA-binding MarR family transcriptional regulator
MPAEPSGELARLLSHTERRLAQRLAAVLAEEGCSVEQWRVLSIAADGQGHPMTEIAGYALLPAPSLTKLVDRMIADNLVYRRPDPADRRRVLLHLSARGRILHERAAHRVHTDQVRLLDAIGDHGELGRTLLLLAATLDGAAPDGVADARRAGRA